MTPDTEALDRVEKGRAYEAVLKSRTFARSDQLQGFLRYICELELAGRGHEITEYSIAIEALNRPSDYASGEDSSVRSRAHSLRRKLQEYYESEARDAEWHIELPKGSYRPLFVSRNKLQIVIATPQAAVPAVIGATAANRPRNTRAFLLGALLAGGILMAAGALFFAFRAEPVDRIVHQAWGPLLTHASDVLVVVGCPPLVRTSLSGNGATKSSPLTIAPPEIAGWYDSQNLERRSGQLFTIPTRGYSLFADTLAATHVTSLLTAGGATFQVVPEPFVQLVNIHERGLIVIGGPTYAALAARVLKGTPFSIRYDREANDEVISDGRVVFGPKRSVDNRFSTVYGLITVLPSQPGRNRPERTIIFSGITGSPGAQAAVQFFTSAAALRDLRARFQKEGHAEFPTAYQVVVRSGVEREASINSVYETHRVMATAPVID